MGFSFFGLVFVFFMCLKFFRSRLKAFRKNRLDHMLEIFERPPENSAKKIGLCLNRYHGAVSLLSHIDYKFWLVQIPSMLCPNLYSLALVCYFVCHRFNSFSWNWTDLSGILRSPSLGTPNIVIVFPIPTIFFPQSSPSPIVPYDYRYWIIRDPIVLYEALSPVSNAEKLASI